MNAHLAYATAYELEAGGFRGVVKNMRNGEIQRGDVRSTMDEARNDAKAFVWKLADGRNMATGSYPHSKTRWRMNYYIRSDEV